MEATCRLIYCMFKLRVTVYYVARLIQEGRTACMQAVHIGDSLAADIRGGINATLAATVWVNKHGHPLPRGAPVPSYTVSHVTELPGVLNTIGGSDIST